MGSAPADTTPQFDVPFRFDSNGLVATVEQDTLGDIGGRVYNVLTCIHGEKLADPSFGIPSPLFRLIGTNGVPTQDLVSEIERQVPEATIEIIQQALQYVTTPQVATLNIVASVGVIQEGSA